MKTKLLTIALGFIGLNALAQITVTDTDIIEVGDVIYQASDSIPSTFITIGNSGANQSWDFSSLQEMETETIEVISPVGTLYGSMYPNANLCIEMDDDLLYLDKTSNGVEMVGFGNLPVNMLMIPLPLTYNLIHQDGPNTIMDSVFANSGLFDNSLAPVISSNPLYDQVDSLKIKVVITSDFNVDSWGNVTIPLGSFDALRLKVEETTTTEFYTYCSSSAGLGGGWFSAQAFLPIETEIANRYQWWANDPMFKFMLAELEVDSLDNVEKATFLIENPMPAAINDEYAQMVSVYPIPTSDKLIIESKSSNLTDLTLFDVMGKLVFSDKFSGTTQIDLTQMSKGIYYLHLKTTEGELTKKIIVE